MTPGADRTVELLTTGAADIGVIRSGELVTAGASSLSGLQAPFVVTNNQQAAAIAADPIADKAMADLAKINLVGLALVPGGLRHPFGYGDKPLLGASDFRTATINTRSNDAGVAAMMAALGAQEDHSIGDERTTKVKDGQLRGMDTSLYQFGGVDRPAVVTTNVALYSKFDVIVVREAVWTAMSPAQQEELKSAAAAVRVSAPAARGSEEHVLTEWCHEPGAGAARASDAELSSLHAVLDPVTATLESDGVAKEVIDRMRALHAGTTDPPTDLTCAQDQPSASAWQNLAPVGDQTVLDGTWRFTPTEADLLAAGATASDARNNAIVWEVTLRQRQGHRYRRRWRPHLPVGLHVRREPGAVRLQGRLVLRRHGRRHLQAGRRHRDLHLDRRRQRPLPAQALQRHLRQGGQGHRMTRPASITSPGSGRSSLTPGILAVVAAVTALLVAATELDAGVGISRSLAVALPAIALGLAAATACRPSRAATILVAAGAILAGPIRGLFYDPARDAGCPLCLPSPMAVLPNLPLAKGLALLGGCLVLAGLGVAAVGLRSLLATVAAIAAAVSVTAYDTPQGLGDHSGVGDRGSCRGCRVGRAGSSRRRAERGRAPHRRPSLGPVTGRRPANPPGRPRCPRGVRGPVAWPYDAVGDCGRRGG